MKDKQRIIILMNLFNFVSKPMLLAFLLGSLSLTCPAECANASHKKERRSIDLPLQIERVTPEQKHLLLQSIQDKIANNSNRGSSGRSKRSFLRKLAEGDWDFLNAFFETLDISAQIDETFEFGSIAFTIGEVVCNDFRISDIITEGSGNNTHHDISLLVTGITVTCKLDYSYDGGFFIGSGNDILEIEISPDSNIETILTFISDNFSIDPPTTSKLTCLPSIKIGDISFSNFWLDLLVAPFLADTIEPYLEPTICEPLVTVESILSDSVLMISDVLDGLADPISPELTDKLAPEMKLFHDYSKPIYVDFVSMQPIVDLVSDIIEILVNSISDTISEDDGPISIPLNLTLDENMGIDLHEIRIIGLNNFTFDPLSLVGNYTLSTTYELDYIGLEVELGIRNADGGKDIMMMKLGVNDVVSDFALLLVIEQSIFEAIEEIFPIVDAIMNLNITDVDYDAIASSLTDAAMEIISSVNITDLITDIGNIEDISQVMDIIADVLSQLDINEIISKIDFSAFAGLIEIFQELMEQLQNFDIFGVLNHVANSIYAIEIASFSLTSSSFDALEISGLTQFIGLQLMFNEVSEAVFSMYDASLINVVDFFLQSTTRGFINAVIGESFVNDSCLDEFLGSIVYFPHDDACAKLELYDGGELSLDYSNPSCSQHLFSGEQLSVFNKSTENVAYFMGDSQWEVEFVEDFSVPELQVVSGMDNVTETWHVTLTYPSCTQSFTVNTSTPTDPPTVVPTVVPTVNATQNVTEKNNTGGVTGTYTNAGRSLLETVLNFFYPRQKDDELEWQRW